MAKLEKEKLEKLQSFVANKDAIIKEVGARTIAYNLIPKLQEQLEKLEVSKKSSQMKLKMSMDHVQLIFKMVR